MDEAKLLTEANWRCADRVVASAIRFVLFEANKTWFFALLENERHLFSESLGQLMAVSIVTKANPLTAIEDVIQAVLRRDHSQYMNAEMAMTLGSPSFTSIRTFLHEALEREHIPGRTEAETIINQLFTKWNWPQIY